jgi:Protein of unknown function (DUF4239)
MTDIITQYTYGPLFPLTLIFILIGVLAYQIIFSLDIFSPLSNQPIIGPFVSLPAIAFFFMVGFISLHQFSRLEDAKQTLAIEVSSIENMLNVPDTKKLKQQEIRFLLKEYLDVSLNEEWAGSLNRVASLKINQITQKMMEIIYAPHFVCSQNNRDNDNCVSLLLGKSYVDNLLALSNAHNKRIQLGQLDNSPIRWYLCLGLAFIAALTTTAIHRANKLSAIISLILFMVSAWLTVATIALHYSPYRGPNSIQPIPLIDVQKIYYRE